MARPKGHLLNPDAFDAWITARGMSRTQVAEAAGIRLNTLSGMARRSEPHGASTAVAFRVAAALTVPPGALFFDLVGQEGHQAPEAVPAS